jgi:hypothetical protein
MQMEPGVNFVENQDAIEKITLYQALNQSQAQNGAETRLQHILPGILDCDLSAISRGIINPKFEARNPKQTPMLQIQMTKTGGLRVSVLNIEVFEF